MGRMQTPASPARATPETESSLSQAQASADGLDDDRSLPEGLRAFGHRDYRVFWFTQLFSLTGTWVQSLAQSWLVLTLTDSPAALGLIGVCQFGPTLILGLPAGVLIDRLPKRRLLMVTQIAAATVIGVLALLVATGRVQLWQIYMAAIALGIVSAVDMPARQSYVVDLVGEDDLMNAIALNSALFNTTRVAGPALAGLLLAAFGTEICFVLNAVSYIPVIAALGVMRTQGSPKRGGEDGSAAERLREGLAYVRRSPAVRLPITLAGLGLTAVLAMGLMAGTGFAMSTTMALANTTVQTNSPDWLRGRVMSIYMTVFAGSTPIGAALAGFLSGLWGAPVAVAVGGGVVAVVALMIGSRLARIERGGEEQPVPA